MNNNIFAVSLLIGAITLIGSITFYKHAEMLAIKSNVESAIVKGIDPVAVRCAYVKQSDLVCVAYAASQNINPKK